MASAITRELADNILADHPLEREFSNHFYKNTYAIAEDSCDDSGSAYTLANDVSQLSDDVDRWIYGSRSRSTFHRPQDRIQPSLPHRGFERPPPGRGHGLGQAALRSEPVTYTGSGFTWCVAAILLPLITARNSIPWLCTQTAMYNATEALVSQFARLRGSIKVLIQRIAREPVARDLCAAALDTLLVVYAIGFLGLSLYQASVFG